MKVNHSIAVWIILVNAYAAQAQQKRMTYTALANELAESIGDLEYNGVKFENDLETAYENKQDLSKPDLFNSYLRKLLPITPDGYYQIKKQSVVFKNCVFDNDFILKGLQFQGVVGFSNPAFLVGKSITPMLAIDSCKFDSSIWVSSQKQLQTLIISNTKINQQFLFDVDEAKDVRIESSYFTFNDSTIQRPFSLYIGSSVPAFSFSNNQVNHNSKSTALGGFLLYSGYARINDSKFYSANTSASLGLVASNTSLKSMIIRGDQFDIDVFLYPPVDVDLGLIENKFNRKLGWEYTGLAASSAIDWETLPLTQFGFYFGIDGSADYPDSLFFNARNDFQLDQRRQVKKLLKLYKGIYDLYKLGGDLESANAAYIVIRDLETRYLERIQENKPSFENLIKIKLNHLLRFYSLYATSPARAIIVSIWVIIGFAVFYLFFPSTWDVSSKSKLIQNFKDFAEKNEKGYIKPFFVMLAGFLISVLNALTLSLNSFVTLGFGEIPTKGAARYVTIVQGFLGWFLLSIFTVAVINQALF